MFLWKGYFSSILCMCSWRGAVIDQGQASDTDIKEAEIQEDPLGVLTCNYMVFFQFRNERKAVTKSISVL